MPRSDELLDERVRRSLEQLRIGPTDVATATATVRHRAATRLRRRRAAFGAVAAVAVGVLSAALLLGGSDDDTVITEPAVPSSTTTTTPYGFAPLTPLIDEPIPTTDVLEITKLGERTLVVHSEPNKLSLALRDPIGSGSMSADPMRMNALVSGASSGGSFGPDDGHIYGITRAEVAFVELTVGEDDPIRQPTLAVDELPQLRFFVFEVPAARLDSPTGGLWTLAAFDAEDRLLTDSEKVLEEQEAFEAAMDDRAGVEVRQAGILDVAPEYENAMVLRVFACGGEPMPSWTEDADAIRVSVTVKVPVGTGDCTSGSTVESHIGLDAPLGDRAVIDARTGEPIPRRA